MKKFITALAIVFFLSTPALADKVWTATGLDLPQQFCARKIGDTGIFSKPYGYTGPNVPENQSSSVQVRVEWSTLPENVRTAMATINAYLDAKAYEQEPDIEAP